VTVFGPSPAATKVPAREHQRQNTRLGNISGESMHPCLPRGLPVQGRLAPPVAHRSSSLRHSSRLARPDDRDPPTSIGLGARFTGPTFSS